MAQRKNTRRALTQKQTLEVIGYQILQVRKQVEALNQEIDNLSKVLMAQCEYNHSLNTTIKKFWAYLSGQSIEGPSSIQ
jgi:hypothetical protein